MFSASLHATIATEMLCMVLRVSALAIVPDRFQSCSTQKPQKRSGSFIKKEPPWMTPTVAIWLWNRSRVARREAGAPEFARLRTAPIPRACAQRARASRGIFHRQKKLRVGGPEYLRSGCFLFDLLC